MNTGSHNHRLKVDVSQLTLGMYVTALDRPWLDTPVLFQGYPLNTQQEILQLQQICQFVWIDTQRSVHLPVPESLAPTLPPAPQASIGQVAFYQEIRTAEPTWHTAREISLRILQDVTLGQELDVAAVKGVIKDCVDSILRTPSAMLWLARLKDSDFYTAEHSLRVAILSIALGRELGLQAQQLEELGICGMLHDVGKLKIPAEILNKPDSLSEAEMQVMRSHADEGRKLLLGYTQIEPSAIEVAYSHHERLDGQGYPRGLQGSDISYFAKIVAVTDSYDAINSDRVYNKGKSTLESLRILYDAAGSFFDADIVVSFINLIGIYPPGEIVELSNGEVAIIISCSRDSKLRPRLLCVLDAGKQPCAERIIDLKHDPADDAGRPYRVQAVYPSGAFGLDIDAYRRRGLIVHQDVEPSGVPHEVS